MHRHLHGETEVVPADGRFQRGSMACRRSSRKLSEYGRTERIGLQHRHHERVAIAGDMSRCRRRVYPRSWTAGLLLACSVRGESPLAPTTVTSSSANGGQERPLGLHASAGDDPVVRLAGDLGDALEVGVVVQHGQVG